MESVKEHVQLGKWIEYLSGERITENKDTWGPSHIIKLQCELLLISSRNAVPKFAKELTI
jgi:hypothetical protein